jgi:hypothetical protein
LRSDVDSYIVAIQGLEAINKELRSSLDEVHTEYQQQFWKGVGWGAGGAATIIVIVKILQFTGVIPKL